MFCNSRRTNEATERHWGVFNGGCPLSVLPLMISFSKFHQNHHSWKRSNHMYFERFWVSGLYYVLLGYKVYCLLLPMRLWWWQMKLSSVGSGLLELAHILAGRSGKAFPLFCKVRSAAMVVAFVSFLLDFISQIWASRKRPVSFLQVITCEPLFDWLAPNEAAETVMGFLLEGGCPSLCFAYDSYIFEQTNSP